MRASESCILPLLLAGLLAGCAEGYSVKGALQNPVPPQQGVVKGWPENSKDSIEDDTNDDPDYVPDYDDVNDDSQPDDNDEVPYDDGSDGYPAENDPASQDGGGSFIASEETEDGKLWLSDDDPDWTPSQSQEGQNYGDNNNNSQETLSQDDDTQEDDHAQGGIPPFPDVTSHPGGVTAESVSQQDTQEHYSQEPVPVKGKRNVKRSYQVSQQVVQEPQQVVQESQQVVQEPQQVVQEPQPVVQEPQQVVQVSAPYGNEQDKVVSGISGLIQEGQGGHPGVSTGVEPVYPVGGPQLHEVGAGVEPEQGGAFGDKDKESSGSSIGGWFREGWNKFTGAVEDLGDRAEDSFRSLGDKVEHAAGHVHETVSAAVDKLHQTYDDVREKLPQILERFKVLIRKFGAVIQEGARYCLQRFEHTFDKVRGSQVIVKLENELQEGHAEVAKFFQILGEKVQAWRVQHSSGDVDSGLLDPGKPVTGQIEQQEGPHREDFEDMPDFFQDDQVIVQLNKLKEVGVLTDDDIIILTQEHVGQDQQNQQNQNINAQQEQNQNINAQQEQNQNINAQQEQNQNINAQQEQNQNINAQQEQNQNINAQQEQNQNYDSQQQNQQQNYYTQQRSQSTGQAIQFPH